MPTHKSNDYKLTAVQYYLVEDKTQYWENTKNVYLYFSYKDFGIFKKCSEIYRKKIQIHT
jgi:hypothetical protein